MPEAVRLDEHCVDCHWWTGSRHHEYGICRVTTNKRARLSVCDCNRFHDDRHHQASTDESSPCMVTLSPLKRRIVEALLLAPNGRLGYHDLARLLWPVETHARAWNYSNNGGPPGWAMPLGRALRELREAGIAYEALPLGSRAGHGQVVLLSGGRNIGGLRQANGGDVARSKNLDR